MIGRCERGGSIFVVVVSRRSVVDDDGASHPQAGVRMRGGEDQPLRRALGDPA